MVKRRTALQHGKLGEVGAESDLTTLSTQCTPLQACARSRLLAEGTVQAYLFISYL